MCSNPSFSCEKSQNSQTETKLVTDWWDDVLYLTETTYETVYFGSELWDSVHEHKSGGKQ